MWQWFYDIPTTLSFIIFVGFITLFSLLGLYLFKILNIETLACSDYNTIISIFITIISLFVGILLSFLIVEVWDNFNIARLDAINEASTIFILYQTMSALPNTENIQDIIVEYLEYVINIEYPALKDNNMSPEGNDLIIELQNLIYDYQPVGDKQLTLYNESIDLLNQVISYRLDRLDSATVGINDLVWWITISNSILLMVMIWFIVCHNLSHYMLTAVISFYISSSIFLVIILSHPFRGAAGIPPIPFEDALDTILSEN